MVLFTRRPRITQLAAISDVVGLRDALVEAARLGSARADKLAAAASALVDLGEDGITALLDTILTDPDHVHFGWIDDETFHRAAGPGAVAQLSEVLLHDPDRGRRLVACLVLRRLETSLADEAFAEAVVDVDPQVRLWAACGLSDHGDGRGMRALVDWSAHADDPRPALSGIVRLGDVRMVPILQRLRDARNDPKVVAQFDRAIGELRAAGSGVHPPGLVARLEAVRDQLRSIEVVDGVATRSRRLPAGQHIPVICDNIDHAVAALRTGKAADGRSIGPAQLGLGLAALVADVTGPDFATEMATVLEPCGVRALQHEIAELDRIATELQEGGTQAGRAGA